MPFKAFKITADDCWWISKAEIAEIRETWKEYPEFAGSILGENFLSLVQDAVINGKALDELLANPPARKEDGDEHVFCDFAWSNDGDENVIAHRKGNVITLAACFHSDHLIASPVNPSPGIVERCISTFLQLNIPPGNSGIISGDEGGGGQLVMDALDAAGWFLNRVNNGAAATDSDHYANTAAEMWYEGGKHITNKTFILPKDQMMRGQLLNRKRAAAPGGKLGVETKKDMKKRGVPSPDRGDAVLGCMMPTGGFGPIGVSWAIPMACGSYQMMEPSEV